MCIIETVFHKNPPPFLIKEEPETDDEPDRSDVITFSEALQPLQMPIESVASRSLDQPGNAEDMTERHSGNFSLLKFWPSKSGL